MEDRRQALEQRDRALGEMNRTVDVATRVSLWRLAVKMNTKGRVQREGLEIHPLHAVAPVSGWREGW